MPTIELCVPGGWLQKLSLNLGEICARSSSLAMSCVAFGVGAPKVHWSKQSREVVVRGHVRVFRFAFDSESRLGSSRHWRFEHEVSASHERGASHSHTVRYDCVRSYDCSR
eukprot:1831247-Pleurochrysis_carterae.AAC.1